MVAALTEAEVVLTAEEEEEVLAALVLVLLAVVEVVVTGQPIPNQMHQVLRIASRCSRARFWLAAAVAWPVTEAVAVVETETVLTREAVWATTPLNEGPAATVGAAAISSKLSC